MHLLDGTRSGPGGNGNRASGNGASGNGASGNGASGPVIRSAPLALTELAPGMRARVVEVSSHGGAASLELGRRLAEIGFLPGEAVRVLARGLLARDPIAVRVGTGTFALRLFEAACVRVCPEPAPRA